MPKKLKEKVLALIVLVVYLVIIFSMVKADPIPPTVTYVSNETMGAAGAIGYNVSFTGNGSHAGGYIFTVSIYAKVQNKRWKAFVGNATGKLTLDDGDGYTIFDWDQFSGTVGGEVYATRWPSAVSWANINCTWGYNNISNKSFFAGENTALSLTAADSVNRTFNDTQHPQVTIGDIIIPADECFSTRTYINDSRHTNNIFTELVLYDGTTDVDGRIIYATIIDTSDSYAYRNDTNYDFQMIVPENGSSSAPGVTPYYFYVELEE